jgi:hypothetical protein
MEKPHLIGYVGVIGSGKDYNCKLLQEKGYLHINFADSLRELTWGILRWKPNTDEEYENFKKTVFKMDFPLGSNSLENIQFDCRYLTGRQILQRIGGLSRKTFGEDCWIRAYFNRIENYIKNGYIKFCTSDIRYPNELQAIMFSQLFESKIYFTNYISEKYISNDTHESEKMAQKFLSSGLKHMEQITPEIMTVVLGN